MSNLAMSVAPSFLPFFFLFKKLLALRCSNKLDYPQWYPRIHTPIYSKWRKTSEWRLLMRYRPQRYTGGFSENQAWRWVVVTSWTIRSGIPGYIHQFIQNGGKLQNGVYLMRYRPQRQRYTGGFSENQAWRCAVVTSWTIRSGIPGHIHQFIQNGGKLQNGGYLMRYRPQRYTGGFSEMQN